MPANHYRQQMLRKKQAQQQRNASKAKAEQQQQSAKMTEEEQHSEAERHQQATMDTLGFSGSSNSSLHATKRHAANNSNSNNVKTALHQGDQSEAEDAQTTTNAKAHQQPANLLSEHSPRYLDVSGLRGIPNLGNTCFMNAALQALSHITPLRMYFIRTYFRRLRTQAEVSADALFDSFIRAMWAAAPANRDYVDPYGMTLDAISPVIAKSLATFMWKRFPFLHPGEQHDAQEFLRCFLNELHDSLKTVDLRGTETSLHAEQRELEMAIEGVRGLGADRARVKSLANELLAMSLRDAPQGARVYREKLDQFIQLTMALAEQPSETEEDDDCDRANANRHRATTNNSENISTSPTSGSATPSCASCDSVTGGSSSCSSCLLDRGGDVQDADGQTTQANSTSSGSTLRRASQTSAASGLPGSSGSFESTNRVQSRSIITDVFTGELENTIRCTACNHVSVQIESFQDLSIPISIIDKAIQSKYRGGTSAAGALAQNRRLLGSRRAARATTPTAASTSTSTTAPSLYPFWPFTFGSDLLRFYYNYFWSWLEWFGSLITPPTVLLADCLDMFFNPEMLENENRYSCDACHKLCNGVKCIRIKRLPEVLTIHLNRYQNVNSSLHKITSNLQFPLVDFDVGKYMSETVDCSGGQHGSTPMANYELVAVVCHSGSQITNGHYTCYALNDVNFEWYEYDDTRVSYVNSDVVQSAAGANAYILFYQRATGDSANGAPASKGQAAMSLAVDLEQMWLERYWKPSQTLTDPLRDYYFFSQNTSNLIACFNGANTAFASFTEATLNEQSVIVSKYWLNLFLTTMDPGPIDNSDIFCRHRRIRPTEWMYFNTMSVPLIEPVGQLLYALYGGGPMLAPLYGPDDAPICLCCAEALNSLRFRRSAEYSRFQMLQSVAGLVFKRIRLRKADSVIEFEMLGGGDAERAEDEANDNQGGKSSRNASLDVMDSLDDTDIDVELNCSKPIPIPDAVPMSTLEEEETQVAEEDDAISVDQVEDQLEEQKPEEAETSEQKPPPAEEQSEPIEEGRQIVECSQQQPEQPLNLYEEYPVEEVPTHYYLISAEWLQQWLNFVSVDFGEASSARNRQLLAIYQKITSQAEETAGSRSSDSSYRHSLNPTLEPMPDAEFPIHLPHPPFASLLKPQSIIKDDGILNIGASALGGGDKNFELEQLWSQIDFHLHTIVPPGPIDNWSLFGIKRKLLGELRKKGTKNRMAAECALTNYNDLVRLLAQCLTGEQGSQGHLDGRTIDYHFSFAPRLHGGISEEKRSCQFYLLSGEYWQYFSSIYGGGPLFRFDYASAEQKFHVHIGVEDVEHFIRDHYKGTGSLGLDLVLSRQLTPSSSVSNVKRSGSVGTRGGRHDEEEHPGCTLRRRTVSASCTKTTVSGGGGTSEIQQQQNVNSNSTNRPTVD